MDHRSQQSLIEMIKARGWQDAARAFLDIIEPIAPIVSQLLWVLQPAGHIIDVGDDLKQLADLLETAEGVQTLRQSLED